MPRASMPISTRGGLVNARFEVRGGPLIARRLKELALKMRTKIAKKVVRAGGAVFQAAAQSGARRRTGHMHSEIRVSVRVLRERSSVMSALVGPTTRKNPAGRGGGKRGHRASDVARWNEYGTKRMPARPFMRPAFERAKDEASRAVRVTFAREWKAVAR